MDDEELREAENLKRRFEGVKSRARFARNFRVPGGGSMIYQHINGLRPISMECAIAYANGFGCTLSEISERLAKEAQRSARLLMASYSPGNQAGATSEKPLSLPGLAVSGAVPLISWLQAGDWVVVVNNDAPGWCGQTIRTAGSIGKHTYALRVINDAMTNPCGYPSFPEGTLLIVEPELVPVPNDYIIVRCGNREATFKKLIKDGDDWYLKPLNPEYPTRPLPDDAVICGVVRRFGGNLRSGAGPNDFGVKPSSL